MADILKDLVEAANDDLELRMGDDTFTWLHAHEIINAAEPIPEDLSIPLPCVLVSGEILSLEPICIKSQQEVKVYQITLSILKESVGNASRALVGDAYETGLYTMSQEVEDVYRRETFNLSDYCVMLAPDYSIRAPTEIGGQTVEQVHLPFQHTYYDGRSDSVFRYIMKFSGVQTLGAADQLTVTHPTMLVASDGGAVPMTSTPTIAAGQDGQLALIKGTSDTNYPIFQDSSNLVGSGLKFAGKRDVTLALNDSVLVQYHSSQSAWVETLGRVDVY